MRTLPHLTALAAGTLSLSACAAYDAPPTSTPPADECPVYESRDWQAWIDTMPGPGAKPTLHITGEVDMPTPGWSVELIGGPADRMNPPGLRFRLEAEKPDGMTMQVITPTEVRYAETTPYSAIRQIVITCGDEALATITDVPVVQ
ncbi:hypothetical protein [Alteriqipengyuania lutimaris]|uniref:Lipoprotein n=1 Tax=Alteriqipengyuania lutimaris TaxID=1538146 RepID=A0A395LRX8_9SPHN|nr:hypothetical protein [Alteriqipengyuania lutimaris]MBB3032651.1 hypothetical protein [Alteriqipengyuania lutimaris]RDS78234.1 hypothetical protein DL238_11875 [Alteriqipengyuania lutimaris]